MERREGATRTAMERRKRYHAKQLDLKLLKQVEANEQEAREQREAREVELRRERKEEQRRKAKSISLPLGL